MTNAPDDGSDARFPYQPVALKIFGDGVLAATLLGSAELPQDAMLAALGLGLLIAAMASVASGVMLTRLGREGLWEVTSIACLGAMTVLLLVHGLIVPAVLFWLLARWRWNRLLADEAAGTA